MSKENLKRFDFYSNSFDWVCLVASLWVMLAHTINYSAIYDIPNNPLVSKLILNPSQAVVILFFSSGYLCYPSYLRSLSAIDFTIKRFFRVIPYYHTV